MGRQELSQGVANSQEAPRLLRFEAISQSMNSTIKAFIGFALILIGLGWLGVKIICIQGPSFMHKSGVMLSFSEVYTSQCRK